MEPIEVAQRYFNAWNERDPLAIVATLAEGGTYSDPASGGALTGEALIQYTTGLFAAFPDLSFEIVSAAPSGDGAVSAQWLMKGTNTGPFGGGPPTGSSVALPGADFISVDGDKILSIQGYFDQRTLVEQLGLQVVVQPHSIGPFSFGTSVRTTTGKRTKPGAFSTTWIEVHSDDEVNEVRERSRQILQEMMQLDGFISAANMVIGHRLITTTAWEDLQGPAQILGGGAHKEAMDRFFGQEFASAGTTMVWVADHRNTMWVRCGNCGQMEDYDRSEGKCRCGEALPEHPSYW